MRIPTILAIAILVVALIVASVSLYFYQQKEEDQRKALIPKGISIVNISDTSASIYWESDVNTTGAIIISVNNNLEEHQDDRIYQQQFTKHISTIKNLSSDTKYTFSIKSNDQTFNNNSYQFKTAKRSSVDNSLISTPLFGTVVDNNLQAVEEAVVTLDIKNFSKVLAISDITGNFVIPLNNIYDQQLAQKLDLANPTEATLTITKGGRRSAAQVVIPPKNTLPPITLGQDINLKEYLATTSATITSNSNNKYDLNGDNKINSLDLSQVIQSVNNKANDRRLDFNNDGTVDQKDVDLISQQAQ